jgi:hypothetical protein
MLGGWKPRYDFGENRVATLALLMITTLPGRRLANCEMSVVVGSARAKAATYRLHAAHCAEIAQRSLDPETRVSIAKMSVAWLRLAELAETNRESQSPVASRSQFRADEVIE